MPDNNDLASRAALLSHYRTVVARFDRLWDTGSADTREHQDELLQEMCLLEVELGLKPALMSAVHDEQSFTPGTCGGAQRRQFYQPSHLG